jgi:hypothetical protein
MEVYGQGAVFEVSDILTGKFPKVQLEGGKFPAWKIDWKGDGEMPPKGAMITWSGQREAGSDGKEYWKMYDFEYSKTPTKPNGGAQQVSSALPQSVQQQFESPPVSMREAGMFAMGTVGRWVGNQKDFPQEEELTGMIQNAKNAYINGMK